MSKTANSDNPRFFHAARRAFCAIFEEDMNGLYSLALLLTADHTLAEQCFVAALDDCLKASDVFADRARSWSRRAIVKQAIRTVNPMSDDVVSAFEVSREQAKESMSKVPGLLLQLRPFERFVFAMAVLERYTVVECAALLNCGIRDVERARVWALQHIAGIGRELQRAAFTGSSSQEPAAIFSTGGAA